MYSYVLYVYTCMCMKYMFTLVKTTVIRPRESQDKLAGSLIDTIDRASVFNQLPGRKHCCNVREKVRV